MPYLSPASSAHMCAPPNEDCLSGLPLARSLSWVSLSHPLLLSLPVSLSATGTVLVPPSSTINAVSTTCRSGARLATMAMLPTIKTMAAGWVPNWIDGEGPQSSKNYPRNLYGPHRGRRSRVRGRGGAGGRRVSTSWWDYCSPGW